jgi:hypothetical protein
MGISFLVQLNQLPAHQILVEAVEAVAGPMAGKPVLAEEGDQVWSLLLTLIVLVH